MEKIKTTQIPNCAKDLYIQLYCEKRGTESSECVHNATQSWLSLSLTKKRHFYNTISTKTVVKKGQRIIQSKPFLKAKDPHRFRQRKTLESNEQIEEPGLGSSTSNHDLPIQHDVIECDSRDNSLVNNENSINGSLPGSSSPRPVSTALEESEAEYGSEETQEAQNGSLPGSSSPRPVSTALDKSEAEYGSEETQNEPQINEAPARPSYMNVIDEDTNTSIENNSNEKPAEHSMPIEPIVPIIKNGRELFKLLNSRKGTNIAYETLTAREKRFYGNAVCRIKREFVTQYKAYLESLTSRQLFDYYSKVF